MVFNSFKFLLFFIAVLSLFFFIPQKQRKYFLLFASYFFYMSWHWEYGFLLLFSTLVQYYCAIQIEKNASQVTLKKLFLYLGIGTDLSMLFFFKYVDFVGSNIFSMANLLGFQPSWTHLNIILPVGISFYVFQTLSYTVDVYQGKMKAERDFSYFALYVSFFPQLVAGPIERASYLLPQLKETKVFSVVNLLGGGKLMVHGLFKKMVVADNLAPFVDKVYAPNYPATGLEYAMATFAFMFQIYGDFSGYSDIARGVAKVFGYELMVNFKQPFFATTVSEYWQRWHVSLATWVRDYIYIPLGGNKKGEQQEYVNLSISMFVMGIWHGAKWTMVAYAVINSISVVVSRAFQKHHVSCHPLPNKHVNTFLHIILVLLVVWFQRIFFRSETIHQSFHIIQTIFAVTSHGNYLVLPIGLPITGAFFLFWVLVYDYYIAYGTSLSILKNAYLKIVYYTSLITVIAVFGVFKASQFIYFQF